MSGSVRIQLPIHSDESLFGYLARVADANGYDRSTWLLPVGQQRLFNTAEWTDATIAHVARIVGLSFQDIETRLYSTLGNGRQNFFGDRIRSELTDQRKSKCIQKFCPDCLRETGYHSALFDLVLIQVCPRHGRRLTGDCPHCRKPVYWGRPSLITCTECGGDLTTAETAAIPIHELVAITAIVKRLGFPHRHPNLADTDLKIANELAYLSTGELLELMFTFAGYLGHRSTRSNFLRFSLEMRADLHLILNASLPFVQSWPKGLYEFLKLYSSPREENTGRPFGVLNAFGPFYTVSG